MWSRILGLGSLASVGGVIVPVKMFVVKTVSDGEVPQVVLLTVLRGFDVRSDMTTSHKASFFFSFRVPSARFCIILTRSLEKTRQITPPVVTFCKER